MAVCKLKDNQVLANQRKDVLMAGDSQNRRSNPVVKKVLLIEPSSFFVQTLKKMIQARLPYVEVVHTDSPEHADAFIETESPDVVFLDISIFPKYGLHYIKSLKRWRPQLKVVALTTHDSDEHKTAALEGGADCFISKNHAGGAHIADFVQAVFQ